MNKRGELFKNLFLVSILVIVLSIGAYFVMGSGIGLTAPGSAGGVNFTLNGSVQTAAITIVPWAIHWANFSTTENITMNFTINNTGTGDFSLGNQSNITYINITMPVGAVLNSTGNFSGTSQTAVTVLSTPQNASNVFSNWTSTQNNVSDVYTLVIRNGSLGHGSGLSENYTIGIIFNLTFNGSALNGTEQNLTWSIDVFNATGVVGGNGHLQLNISNGGVDGLAPRLLDLNVTSSNGHIVTMSSNTNNFNGTGGYLRNDTTLLNFTAMINDTNLNISNVTLYVNVSGHTGGCGACHGGDDMYQDATPIVLTNTFNHSATVKIFSGNISTVLMSPTGLKEGNTTTFSLVATDVFGHTSFFNNSNLGFNVTFDELGPAATINMPATTSIETSQSITIGCGSSDGGSGINGSRTQLSITKPGGSVVYGTAGDTSVKFTNTDTNQAGTYTVKCDVADLVGRTGGATTKTFSVTYASGAGTPSGTGPSGTRADITITEDQGKSDTKAKEGQIKTFTLDGATVHKITFLKVTASSVTLRIESTPVEITLNIGEIKEVDIDGDGNIDIEVTLNGITEGLADLSVKKVGLPAGEVAPEAMEEEGGEEVTPPMIEKESKAGLIITIIIIIIIVVGIAYFLTKKKKK